MDTRPPVIPDTASGYRPCACRDCFEIAIGTRGAVCSECEDAGCDVNEECQAPGAYGGARMTTTATTVCNATYAAKPRAGHTHKCVKDTGQFHGTDHHCIICGMPWLHDVEPRR